MGEELVQETARGLVARLPGIFGAYPMMGHPLRSARASADAGRAVADELVGVAPRAPASTGRGARWAP